uniref:Photolyase/cryptochrome alpha/beta domain-containing protein n=2 Tax=Kalanchoe fedtschenkoi TaxID=63787 RepID=A0A7N1A6T3_KALFE
MSLLLLPHCISFLAPRPFPLSVKRRRSSSRTAVYATATEERNNWKKKKRGGGGNGVAVVWFKHDLRIDDHPGLVAASEFDAVVPLYVFDRRILSRFSGEVLEVLLSAIEDLRRSLMDQGSNLMIRFGDAENIVHKIMTEVKASNLIVEEEVEYQLLELIDSVRETLDDISCCEGSPDMLLWRTSLYDLKSLEDLPASYYDFQKLQVPVSSPSISPVLPQAPSELDWGPLPSIDDLLRFLNVTRLEQLEASNLFNDLVDTGLHQQLKEQSLPLAKLIRELRMNFDNRNQSSLTRKTPRKKIPSSAFVAQGGNLVGGGTNSVLNALAGYLRYLEGTGRDDWQELHEKLRSAETRSGASFGALFGPSLRLGIISKRSVFDEAIKYEKDRNGGFLSPFGYSAITVAGAIDTVSSMEWYYLLALNSRRGNEGAHSIRIWRWNGHLIQYAVAGHEGPSILLVHGFGASLEHYRDNLDDLAEAGNKVWAISLIGFGKSEKPNILYTELLWAEMIKDFVDEVVAEPVHLIGNSLGGYFAAIVAGLWPTLVKSVILINSAGNIVPEFSSIAFLKDRQISGPAKFGARLLLPFLRLSLKNIVADCYPVKKERVDEMIINEMTRASHDPGVVYVLENIFSINLSIPLNYLLEGLGEKVLIIQGMKDPIQDSKTMLAMLRKHCPGFSIRELDAGHCPHDERPEEVNSIIRQWVTSLET